MMMRLLVLILRGLIIAYQWGLKPVLPGACRYTPSCSAYALEALDRHGPLRGTWLAVRRIGRCQPWGGCGDDPVPESVTAPDHRGDRKVRRSA